ncbi:hypothetical protein SAMN05216276_11159 [Streptosporangium subroseum]|uniref:Uncharacterized protein n=2 Tax=Streptosporangium subroseum TaxID=106412 RepID=A0A239PBH8_9ACTN|nr:hypothetical protein SAMN05216276_11159 [Streptosporangium subroseum]
MVIDGFGIFDRIEEYLLQGRVSVMSDLMGSLRLMSRSLKVTRVLLVAAFAAGLSACSGGGDPEAATAAPVVTVTVTASPTPSASPSDLPDPSNADSPETPLPELPSISATPSASDSTVVRGTDAEIMGPVKLLGANSITVTPDHGSSQKAELTPFTVVLDRRGTICAEGGFPHECNVKQMRKTLTSGGSLYAKVTIKDGVATQIEEMAKK